jgi:hypothetical protein
MSTRLTRRGETTSAKSAKRAAARAVAADRAAVKRVQTVWLTFLGAMTVCGGLLLLADGSLHAVRGAPLLGPGALVENEPAPDLFDLPIAIDETRWQGIMVHHSGSPAGDAESIHRLHQSYGLDELGYHFVIGNGNGLGDGVIHVGQRWLRQRAGAHAIGPDQDWHNAHSIAICLIGNGEARPFTDAQMRSLASLTRTLQGRFEIGPDRVYLHREAADVRSPGRFFAEAAFRQTLARTSG